jgi:WD40 repeat protein
VYAGRPPSRFPLRSKPATVLPELVQALVWQVATEFPTSRTLNYEGHIVGLIFTPDSKRLISSSFDRQIKIWDIENGLCLHSWQSLKPCYRLALSNDGKMIATGSECGNIFIWDVDTKKLIKTLVGHTLVSMDVAFHPQDLLLAIFILLVIY